MMKKLFLVLAIANCLHLSFAQNKLITRPRSIAEATNLYFARNSESSSGINKSLPPDGINVGNAQGDQPILKSTCQLTSNFDFAALSTSDLVTYLKIVDNYNCTRLLFNYEDAYSPVIFSNTNIQAVANELANSAAGYSGFFSDGIYGLICYLHVATFFDFYHQPIIALDATSWQAVQLATDALCVNPHLLDFNIEAATILAEFLIDLDLPGIRSSTSTIGFVKQIMRDMVINDTWKTVTDINWVTCYWRIFFLIHRGTQDPDFINAISNDNEFISLLGSIAIDTEIMNNPDLNYIWQDNAILELCALAPFPLLSDEVCSYLAVVCGMFPRLHKNWLYAVTAINDAGKCVQYNLCEDKVQLKLELESLLFPNTYSYDDGHFIFNAKFDTEVADNLYYATRQTQAQLFRLAQTDQPVAGDLNTTLTAIVFESKTAYDNYAPFLFGIPTNNGGMYLEQPAEFYTWDRPASYPLSLEELFRHEFNHYLQGRFLVPGYFGDLIYSDNRLTWYEEGHAELLCASTDNEGIKLKRSTVDRLIYDYPDWPSLSDVFNSGYGQDGAIYYPYGNLVWYNWYKNDYGKIKTFNDLTRNNDILGFDNLVNSLKISASAENQWQSFLADVYNGVIPPWDITTSWISDQNLTVGLLSDIQDEFTAITGITNATVISEASTKIGRFRISGSISGSGTASNNTEAAQEVNQALDALMAQLKSDPFINNFDYIVGYITNVAYPGNIPSADFNIIGSLRDPGIPSDPVADFTSDNQIVVEGSTVNFTSLAMGYVKGFSWSFPGGSPSNSISANSTVTYSSAGTYPVSLTVTGKSPSLTNTKTENSYIKVYAPSTISYCGATHGYDYSWIQHVKLNTIDNTSIGFPPDGYSDFTSNFVTELQKGSTYPISIDLSYTNTASMGIAVWIDFNQNGSFTDPGEQVLLEHPAQLTQLSNATITIPSTASNGVTRMRIRATYIGGAISPCGYDYYMGEVEDYTVVIDNNDCNTALPVMLGENSGYQGTWYYYTSNVPQQLYITSCDPRNGLDFPGEYAYDTFLEIYSDCKGNMIASNDDMESDCGSNRASSAITINLPACTTILIHWPLNYPTAAHAEEPFFFHVTATDTDPSYTPLALTLSGNSPIGMGNSCTINSNVTGGTPPYTYYWINLTETTPSITVSPTSTTVYMLGVVDATGCQVYAYYTVEVKACEGAFLDTRDNHAYGYTTIGNQTWMCENLAYLPNVSPSNVGSEVLPLYYVYGNESSDNGTARSNPNFNTYGVLYNWTAAMAEGLSSQNVPSGVQGVCPDGWHLPSDAEWTVLMTYLGGEIGGGGKMKESGTAHWLNPNTGATNSSGFTALPGGYRWYSDGFFDVGSSAYFWSSTETSTSIAKRLNLAAVHDNVMRLPDYKSYGFSVRCLMDGPGGISEEKALNQVKVYPNPTDGRLTIALNTSITTDIVIELLTITGKQVYHKEIKNVNNLMHEIDVSPYSKGIYFMRISSALGNTIEKIVVQ